MGAVDDSIAACLAAHSEWCRLLREAAAVRDSASEWAAIQRGRAAELEERMQVLRRMMQARPGGQ